MKKYYTFLVLLPLMAVSVSAQSTKRGDVNEDGNVDISDVVELVNIILNGDENKIYTTCPDDGHHPHLIDLGLPSGTLWSCCNVGADKPEAYGGYYAWGETEEKDYYDWSTYSHCDGSSITCHHLGSDIASTQYDVAHAKWGNGWHIPTLTQMEELVNNTTSEWTSENGVAGIKFTGSNGGTIFLPAAGDRQYSELHNAGYDGEYWLSTLYESYERYADLLYFRSGDASRFVDGRDTGRSVRPVR